MRKKAVITVLCILILCGFTGSALAEQQIVMTFLGDCTLGGEERLLHKYYAFAAAMEEEGYGYYFKNVRDLLSEDDITLANLECVLRDTTTGGAKDKTYVFRGAAAYTEILKLGSVEAVSLENNHTLDYGKAGLADTKQALQDTGIAYNDQEDTYFFEKDGVRIAFLSLNGVVWATYKSTAPAFVEKIQRLKEDDTVDAIVVSLHFGVEYSAFHSDGQTNMAHRMIDAGADLIIGTHPHVVQGMEIYNNRLILYSLGNFVFGGNSNVRSLQTIIPRITFSFSDDGNLLGTKLRIYPAHISSDIPGTDNDNNYQPILAEGKQAQVVYSMVDKDSRKSPAPELDLETETYREYQWIDITPAQ